MKKCLPRQKEVSSVRVIGGEQLVEVGKEHGRRAGASQLARHCSQKVRPTTCPQTDPSPRRSPRLSLLRPAPAIALLYAQPALHHTFRSRRAMAPRSRRSAAAAPEAVETEEQDMEQEPEEQQGLKALKFKQTLAGRPGKQISVNDLLARLKTLLDELRTIDQDEAHRDSLLPVAQELAHQSLLQHKDNGVRAWTVCCIVDMLKLFAPDAPYPGSKLKVDKVPTCAIEKC